MSDALILGPLLAQLGLESLPADDATISRAYKKQLRARPAEASTLREAASILATPESRAQYVRKFAMPAPPPLAIARAAAPRSMVMSGGESAALELGRMAYGHASSQGPRPSMEVRAASDS